MEEFNKTILVRKDKFNRANFMEISKDADAEIRKANPIDLLALNITMNSPIKIIGAKIYNRDVFEDILSNRFND